jgi:hypothetical protein
MSITLLTLSRVMLMMLTPISMTKFERHQQQVSAASLNAPVGASLGVELGF